MAPNNPLANSEAPASPTDSVSPEATRIVAPAAPPTVAEFPNAWAVGPPTPPPGSYPGGSYPGGYPGGGYPPPPPPRTNWLAIGVAGAAFAGLAVGAGWVLSEVGKPPPIASPTPSVSPSGSSPVFPSSSPSGISVAPSGPVSATGAPPPSQRPDPADQLRSHFGQINARAYDRSWQNLTNYFQTSKSGGYNQYLRWWQSVANVAVGSTTVLSQTDDSAQVQTTLTFTLNNGKRSTETKRYVMQWSPALNQWQIADSLDGSSSAVPSQTNRQTVSQTTRSSPSAMMQRYYQQVNARNYGSAWAMLSPSFQNEDGKGYRGFVEWWDSVALAEPLSIQVVSQSGDTAVVALRTAYNMKRGNRTVKSSRYRLGWDASRGEWVMVGRG